MKSGKKPLNWPEIYEAPKVFHIDTAYQQALGITACSPVGSSATGTGSCSVGQVAQGGESCSSGVQANPQHQGHGCTKGWKPRN